MTVRTEKTQKAQDGTVAVRAPKKLIEVALPLDDINAACAREKSIRHGHPSTLHLWWARRPLAAARAVLFAQLVNDPGYERSMIGGGQRGMNAEKAAKERERLFGIIRRLVLWENTNNEAVLNEARAEIWKSWRETCELNKNHPQAAELFNPEKLPAFHDPFAGGGSIPLEAQRLGLEAYASDLNPVAVLINKAMIEIPPRFAGMPPVNPEARKDKALFAREWRGAQGLAEDVRYYGKWMRDEAERRIGHLYPKVEVTAEMAAERPDLKPLVGQKLTVIAWIWARTVKSPNPAFAHVDVPLASTFILSSKAGKQAFVDPVVNGTGYGFAVKLGQPPAGATNGTTAGKRAAFRCLMSGTPIDYPYIRTEGKGDRIGQRLMAIVVECGRGRIYLPPTDEAEAVATTATPTWKPSTKLPEKHRSITAQLYGLDEHGKLFTPRQLVTLAVFSDMIQDIRGRVIADASSVEMAEHESLTAKAHGDAAYADAVRIYLAFALDKAIDRNTALCAWESKMDRMRSTFGRQAIPMVWDYVETNPFAGAGGDINGTIWSVWEVLNRVEARNGGYAIQADAQEQSVGLYRIVSTDPPYYNNIGYADLSDFFYPWLRRSLQSILPDLFGTLAVPKDGELVACAYRHGGKDKAEAYFLDGMTRAMHRLAELANPGFPVTIYYAFKQSERSDEGGTASTGWDTFLAAVITAGFAITGTWPMRSELETRSIGLGVNALASSIVLVCRKRDPDAPAVSRREFIRELKDVLPDALQEMTRGGDHSPVAAVDLSQAIIGPGMAVFSKYASVLEANGDPMTVKTALQLINRHLAGDDADFDPATRFCLAWFETHEWDDAKFGEADTLARAKGTSVDTVAATGALYAKHSIVRLLRHPDYALTWSPPQDGRPAVWEALHHLIRTQRTGGIAEAGRLLAHFPGLGEPIRQLAYRLYTLLERDKNAEEARAYNELITSWPSIVAAAQSDGLAHEQGELFE